MVRFVDEALPPYREKYDWPQIAEELKSRPGVWADITAENATPNPTATMAASYRIRKGYIQAMPKGEFESTTRKTVLYARYVGERG